MEQIKNKMSKKSTIENQILVIFGSNGDLSKRKLLPAIFQLFLDDLLPENFILIGAGSQDKDEKTNRKEVEESLILYSNKGATSFPEKLQLFLERL